MHSVEETIEVSVPMRSAYHQWTQFKTFPRFMPWVRRVDQVRPTVLVRVGLRNLKQFIEALGKECGVRRGVVRNGHVRLLEPEPPRSRVPDWRVG